MDVPEDNDGIVAESDCPGVLIKSPNPRRRADIEEGLHSRGLKIRTAIAHYHANVARHHRGQNEGFQAAGKRLSRRNAAVNTFEPLGREDKLPLAGVQMSELLF